MKKPEVNYDIFDSEKVSKIKDLIFKNECNEYNSKKRIIKLEKKILRLEDRIINIEKMCDYCNKQAIGGGE